MNILYILFAILMFIIIAGSGIFLFLTRPGKNLMNTVVFTKKYVVCHLRNDNTEFEEIHRVVPNSDYLTPVGGFDYNLNPAYRALSWKGRNHFILQKNDVIPRYLERQDTKEEILVQVQEVRTALHNKAYGFLYAQKQNLALILCAVALFISLLVALYAVIKIGQVTPILDWLMQHPPGATDTIIVKPGG